MTDTAATTADAARWPSIQPAEPQDWADTLADEIVAEARSLRYTEARALIAARLRELKLRGQVDGMQHAAKVSSYIHNCLQGRS